MHLYLLLRVVRHIAGLQGEAAMVACQDQHISPKARDCFGCGAPDHLLRQCPFSGGQGGPHPRPSVQARPPAPPPYRGRDRA